MNKITSFLFSKPADEIENKRILYFTGTILLTTIIFIAVLSVIKLLLPPEINSSDYMLWGVIVLFLVYYILLKVGKVALAGSLYLFTLWGTMSLLAFSFEGVRDVAIVANIISVLIAIYILRPWQAMLLSVLSIVSLWVIYFAEANQIIFPEKEPSLNYCVEVTIILIIVIVIAFLNAKSFLLYYSRIHTESKNRLVAEEKFRNIFEHSMVGISITSLDGTLQTNKKYGQILGYSESELSHLKWKEITHPDDIESSQHVLDRIMSGETPVARWQKRYIHKNGNIVWADISTILQCDQDGKPLYFIASIIDITDIKKAEIALKKSEELYRTVISNTPVVTFAVNDKGIFTLSEGFGLAKLGLRPGQVVGLSVYDVYREYPSVINSISKALAGFPQHEEATVQGVVFDVFYTPVFNNMGEVVQVIGVSNDITERTLAENNLIKAKEKAEESDRLKTAFLANMSHEIRTPMNGIIGFSELLKEPGLSGETQQEFIGIIERSGARMLNIINDIIDISKIEARQVEVSLSETIVNDQIKYIVDFFKPEAHQKGLQIVCDTISMKEIVIKTDKEKLYAVLANLVKNAIKFTDAGIIEIGYIAVETQNSASLLQSHNASLLQSPHASLLQFFVKDSGIGIPEDRREAIFDRFVQADISDKRAFQGAGLGLSISKAYVEMLGGKIWVESEEGKGSSFYFTIKHDEDMQEKIFPHNLVYSDRKENELIKLKILIVEDDNASEMLITRAVSVIAREILKVMTGIEAIKACRNNPDIDLVLMDIKMPGIDGYEATREIRKFNKDVIIIAQTAFALVGDKDKALEAGCNDYISKPTKKESLLAIIRKQLSIADR